MQNGSGSTIQITSSPDGACTLVLAGAWSIQHGLPSVEDALGKLKSGQGIKKVIFDCTALTGWDSGLLTLLTKIAVVCDSQNIALDTSGLPEGLQRLLVLATAIPERKGARRTRYIAYRLLPWVRAYSGLAGMDLMRAVR